MPPTRQRDSNQVRGPNSALTAFLREQGINANLIRQRHLRRLEEEQEEEQEEGEPRFNVSIEGDDDDVSESEDDVLLRQLAREKRRRLNGSDEEEDEDVDYSDSNTGTPRKSLPGQTIKCIECSKKFKVTVYTKSFVKDGAKGYLCEECNELYKVKMKNMKRNQLKLRKRRQLILKSLLDQKEFNIPKLQDICIKLISDNIDNVESLGDIGSVNYNKLSRILCKNRSLNDKTMSLFLMAQLTSLEFWDCSNVGSDTFRKMILYCPNLESLNLSMCGQFNNENILYLLTSLQKIAKIRLDGPFLINEKTWQLFFESVNPLTSFKLSNTHRFNNECMQSLMLNCGETMQELSLGTLDGLNDPLSYELIPHYFKNLTSLEISYPSLEILDQTLLNILQENPGLETLALEHLVYLTDDAIRGLLHSDFALNLQNLTITNSNITNSGFYEVFSNFSMNHGLMELNLYNDLNLQDDSLLLILNHSKNSLIKLNLNSCKSLTSKFWNSFPKCPLLTILDCGFVRSFDNKALKKVIKQCDNLKILECYGDNRCNDGDIYKTGLKIIGREIDTV